MRCPHNYYTDCEVDCHQVDTSGMDKPVECQECGNLDPRICFLITTFDREQSCQRLVDSLQGIGDIFVLNDGSRYDIKGCYYFSQTKHLGKPGYWRTVNNLWSLPYKEYDFYFMIPDDFLPVDDFVKKTIGIWSSIKDRGKICINTYRDPVPRERCWTNVEPVEFGTYRKTQWVDMCFMCGKLFFQKVGIIPKISYNWQKDPLKSSGVGSYISLKLHRAGLSIYQTKETMFTAQEAHNTSKMNAR